MVGFGRVWNSVTGGRDGERPLQPATTIRRAVPAARPVSFEPAWGFSDVEPGETRCAERFVPNKTATVLTTADGKRLAARIINISRTGVAVEPEGACVSASEIVMAGTRPVVPGRRIALGMVLLFKKPLDPKLCGPNIVL